MEQTFYDLLSVQEKIKQTLKKEKRSISWLAEEIGKSQPYVYRIVTGVRPVNDEFLESVKKALPNADFSPPKNYFDLQSELKDNPLFKDEKE